MKTAEFYKYQASGNDFILIDKKLDYKKFAKKFCQRKTGVGADGLLVIEPSKRADFKMRIFNPDGSEPEMCGNGARCAGLWASSIRKKAKKITFETEAGVIEAEAKDKSEVRIKMTKAFDLKMNLAIGIFDRTVKVNYINTGVPHAVIFVEGLDSISVEEIGPAVRFHKTFKPAGANVDFVEILGKNSIALRTYERGVEKETLACGTGVVASAIVTSYLLNMPDSRYRMAVLTKSGETLKVYFKKSADKIDDVWLEGGAHIVYRGKLSY